MTTQQPPASYVRPDLSEARIERQWRAFSSRLAKRPSRPKKLVLGIFATAIAGLAVIISVRWGARVSPAPAEGMVIDLAEAGGRLIHLIDGSRIEMQSPTRLEVVALRPDRVHLTVVRGAVAFDVTQVPGRVFSVTVRDFEVVVKGTRFRVHVSDHARDSIEVHVDRGQVEIRPRGQTIPLRRLGAGESWTNTFTSSTSSTSSEAPRPAGEAAGPAQTVRVSAAQPIRAQPRPRIDARPLAARRLFEMAEKARWAGDPRLEADAFDALRHRFRDDPRAGLAAFQVGRLRLDSLGDPAGALEALNDAIALSPGAPFREDAEAKLVRALDAMGDGARCRRAREAYLARYPEGAHAAAMMSRCRAP